MEIKRVYENKERPGVFFDANIGGFRINGFWLHNKDGKYVLVCPKDVTVSSDAAKKELLKRAQEALDLWRKKDGPKQITSNEKVKISKQFISNGFGGSREEVKRMRALNYFNRPKN